MVNGTLVNDLLPNPSVYLRIIRFLAILIIGIILTRAAIVPVIRRVLRKREAGTETIHSVVSLTSVIGYFLSFTIALQAANFGSIVTILGAMTAALVVAMGFGMRDQISNIVAGFLIYGSNPFIVGDYIKSQTAEGVVESIDLVSTTLSGSSSQKIVVPNAQLTTEELRNYTKASRTKASIRVTLPLEQLVEGTELLKDLVDKRSEVLDDPAPDIFYSETDGEVYAEIHFSLETSRNAKEIKSDILEDFTRQMVEAGLADMGDLDENEG
ncbi:mechanosensitive ion channel family protein [Halanaeroarchaeum sulfurireducens]|uniref:Potassium efflux system KefA protein / small-conductance mechanosensitive channel n=1 Tax=Halanaeroarchaeum sulfurireducens TaxID=1604004 RepID=A0A0F7P731_9EURY|nr:mechanosensitive ion channel domain-containing protein [Halanaeroarchaeum sulfurireducens]AKH97016.1 potassium efflux system KefA protein / small-conductance mechanosensitive channel [Halanaeroarchaeum sulfurireducens]ALG81417.1 potassium efflux system KefA protein / small-conductance mechanosensitive channel [Halanaeroarchaeum sulfurireducens]